MDHNMVFSYNSNCWWQNCWCHQNIPPLLTILVAMVVCQSNTDGIAQCSMSRATREATGHCHWATTCSVSPQQPPGQQQTTWQQKRTNFDGHFGGHSSAPVQYFAHYPMEEVQSFGRSHWMLPSTSIAANRCNRTHQHHFFQVFSLSTRRKRSPVDAKALVFNRGVTYQTKE